MRRMPPSVPALDSRSLVVFQELNNQLQLATLHPSYPLRLIKKNWKSECVCLNRLTAKTSTLTPYPYRQIRLCHAIYMLDRCFAVCTGWPTAFGTIQDVTRFETVEDDESDSSYPKTSKESGVRPPPNFSCWSVPDCSCSWRLHYFLNLQTSR